MPAFIRLGFLLLSATFCCSLPARAQTGEMPPAKTAGKTKPETVVDDAGRFVATFPGAVQRSSQLVDTSFGKLTQSLVYYDGGTIAFMIGFNDYPANSVSQSGGPEKVCENASDGVVKSLKGTLRTASSCKTGDVTGREIVFDAPTNDVDRARFFVVGDRLYQILYIGPSGETDPAVTAFLDSFRLTR